MGERRGEIVAPPRSHGVTGRSLFRPWSGWFVVLVILLVMIRPAEAQPVGQSAGEMVSVLGIAEVMREGRWQAINTGGALKTGETVRTGEGSRVAIQLANGSQLKLNANSRLELKEITPRSEGLVPASTPLIRSILNLVSGEIWIRSIGEPLEIKTIPATAIIRGTEFNLAVGPRDSARLAVLAGLVEFANPQGSVLVTANEQATAKVGEPPRKTVLINPLDAVQWSLYYPDVVGDWAEPASRADPRTPRYWTWAAQDHLLRGQVPEARQALDRTLALDPNNARAYSLRAVIELVQNRKAEARADAERAVAADPAAPVAHLSLSWVQQAEFDLDGALASARRAVTLASDDPQALIQESRLLFGMGRTREALKLAERARQKVPQDALVNSTWGFLQLARGRVAAADQAFREAIAQDSTLGEPHLGLGLALFRRNQTEEAVDEMRKATLLEPKVSLYNSYLGKAYYEVKQDRQAKNYLALAKQLDPRDPTPHYYDAIRRQSVNQPVEAVRDLQKSIELNDNRAVYRSRLLLDEDLATRDTSLARIYDDLGFNQVAQVEASKSLSLDPANYSAHRFLSDSYATRPRHEIARVSELLQAQLLQPININPVQPSLNETNLKIINGFGTAVFNEYTSLFERDRAQLTASGVIGNHNTLADEVVLSGVEKQFSYSLGQFHYETDGFRENNDQQHDIYNFFMQMAVTPNLSLQAELRRRETEEGDLKLNFNPDLLSPIYRRAFNQDTARLGGHLNLSTQSDLIFSFINTDKEENIKDKSSNIFGTAALDASVKEQGYQVEAQYLFKMPRFNIVAGVGSYDLDIKEHHIFIIPPYKIISDLKPEYASRRDNAYGYTHFNYPDNLAWTVGLSYDAFREGELGLHQFNPKLGLQWNISENARLRLAAFQTVKPALAVEQTLEPTQVAGFNQLYDDYNGTKARQYSIGFDARLSEKTFGGVEVSHRDLNVPILEPSEPKNTVKRIEDQKEDLYRAYLYWMPDSNWSFSAEYQFERFECDSKCEIAENSRLTQLETMTLPLSVQYFNRSGFFANLRGSYVNQDLENKLKDTFMNNQHDDFFVLDSAIGYRLPKRLGILSFEVRNLLDRKFNFQDLNFQTSEARNPRFIPERLLLFQATLNF